jgi:hypothetical protein
MGSLGSTGTASPVLLRIALDDPMRTAEELAGSVPILVAAFDDGAAFLRAYTDRGAAGELSVRTRAAPAADTPIIVEVCWATLPNRVFVRAHAKRRLFGRLHLRFDEDEAPKRDFLLRMARGAAPSTIAVRKHRRFCVRLPLEWRRFGGRDLLSGVAEDLSSGGVLIISRGQAISVGDRVAVRLRTQREHDLVLTGRVRHATTRGPSERAFGVQFEYRSSGEARALRSLLRVFAAKGVVLIDPLADPGAPGRD